MPFWYEAAGVGGRAGPSRSGGDRAEALVPHPKKPGYSWRDEFPEGLGPGPKSLRDDGVLCDCQNETIHQRCRARLGCQLKCPFSIVVRNATGTGVPSLPGRSGSGGGG